MTKNRPLVLRLSLHYIRGVTEPFERVLASHSVTVAQKTLKTLEEGVYLTKDPVLGKNGPILFIPFLAKTVIISSTDAGFNRLYMKYPGKLAHFTRQKLM